MNTYNVEEKKEFLKYCKKLPRSFNRSYSVFNRESYRKFIRENKRYKGKYTQKEAFAMLKHFHEFYLDKVLEHQSGIKLPGSIGQLLIVGIPYNHEYTTGDFIDYNHLNKTGEVRKFSNWETENIIMKITYLRLVSTSTIATSNIWTYIPTIKFKKKAKEKFKENHEMFIKAKNSKEVRKYL